MDQGIVAELAKNGGFALLAGILAWVCFKMGNLRAEDLKMALERETASRSSVEELHRSTLTLLTNLCSEMSTLKESVIGLVDDARSGRLDDTWSGPKDRRRRATPGA